MKKEYYLVTVLSTRSRCSDNYSTYGIIKSPIDHIIAMKKAVTSESGINFILIYSLPITEDQYNKLRLKLIT